MFCCLQTSVPWTCALTHIHENCCRTRHRGETLRSAYAYAPILEGADFQSWDTRREVLTAPHLFKCLVLQAFNTTFRSSWCVSLGVCCASCFEGCLPLCPLVLSLFHCNPFYNLAVNLTCFTVIASSSLPFFRMTFYYVILSCTCLFSIYVNVKMSGYDIHLWFTVKV